jgi:hypothetical protein
VSTPANRPSDARVSPLTSLLLFFYSISSFTLGRGPRVNRNWQHLRSHRIMQRHEQHCPASICTQRVHIL